MFAEIPRMYSNAAAYLEGVKKQPLRRRDQLAWRSSSAETTSARSSSASGYRSCRTIYGQHTPGFYLPFVFNDSPASIATGREVYGYPKQLASLNVHSGGRQCDH